VRILFEQTCNELNNLRVKYNRLEKDYNSLKNKFLAYRNKINIVSNEYEEKMIQLAEKEKRDLQIFKEDPFTEKNTENKLSITSELWEIVIVITSGIENSVNVTEHVLNLTNLSYKDYKTKNVFEISHP